MAQDDGGVVGAGDRVILALDDEAAAPFGDGGDHRVKSGLRGVIPQQADAAVLVRAGPDPNVTPAHRGTAGAEGAELGEDLEGVAAGHGGTFGIGEGGGEGVAVGGGQLGGVVTQGPGAAGDLALDCADQSGVKRVAFVDQGVGRHAEPRVGRVHPPGDLGLGASVLPGDQVVLAQGDRLQTAAHVERVHGVGGVWLALGDAAHDQRSLGGRPEPAPEDAPDVAGADRGVAVGRALGAVGEPVGAVAVGADVGRGEGVEGRGHAVSCR